MQDFAKLLIVVGVLVTVAGVLLYFGGKVNYFGLGRLPGDIRIERENFKFYFPLGTSILISIILSAVLYLIGRLR
ncbi:MAG: DUF2905 domain-containing protein [Candidatus Hydrogenedentes bacterium]|nr:DUF2905 domain-containing protein [Candidatus Hydrogenedentota bacterium]